MLTHYDAPHFDAGWSSMVARRAHNPKVVGSNPAPGTIYKKSHFNRWLFLLLIIKNQAIRNNWVDTA